MTEGTMTNLDELERLLAAATPGPWEANDPGIVLHPEFGGYVAEPETPNQEADTALIVAAVNSLPALIAAARRAEALEKALEAVEWVETESGPGMVDGMCPWCQGWEPNHTPGCERQAALAKEGAPR